MTTADLRPFQRRFLAAALAPGVEVAALSLPRGNGKTTLLALLATRALTPGDPLFVEGAQNVLIAGSALSKVTAGVSTGARGAGRRRLPVRRQQSGHEDPPCRERHAHGCPRGEREDGARVAGALG